MARKKIASVEDLNKNLGEFKSIFVPGSKNGQQHLAAQDIFKKQGDAMGNTFFSTPMPFQPEFGDDSKINFPIDRHQQNRYARMYYRLDPVFGSVIDLFAEMLTSDIEVYGEGVVGDVKRHYEEMIHSTKITSLFSYFIKEFLIVGEVIPHLIFDERKGIWTSIIFHNPDQVNVIDSPFINMEPILEFVPDELLRKFAQSNHPQVLETLATLPQDVVGAISSGQNIPLNTKLNVSFLARKLFPYDVRGTGIFPRMWQILMYEQSVMRAALATARRHAGPIKVAKIGDSTTGWIPPQDHMDDLAQRLALLEQDPHGWLIYHPFIAFDTVGTTDRMMQISREYDLIERVKLTALGVSQGFLHGDSTHAASYTNFNTLMMKLKGMRKWFEAMWWQPKFFKPIAEINEWVLPTGAEVSHKFRKTRTAFENEQRLIVPKIKWRQSLESVVDKDTLEALRLLSDLGVKASKTTAFSAAGLNFEGETTNSFIESKIEKKIKEKILPDSKDKKPEDIASEIAPPGMAAPMPMSEELPQPIPQGESGTSMSESPETLTEIPSAEESPIKPPMETAPASKRGFKVTARDAEDLIDMMENGKTDSDIWIRLIEKDESIKDFTKNCNWDRINDYMEDEGFTNNEIEYVRKSLVSKKVIEANLTDQLEAAVEAINLAGFTDERLHKKVSDVLNSKLKTITETINKKSEKQNEEYDNFLVGDGNNTNTQDFIIMNSSGGNLTNKKIKSFRKKKGV